jgi:hypothetical protein
MKKLALLTALWACLLPQIVLAQTPGGGPVSLVLVTWTQPKSPAQVFGPTAQSVIGTFSDIAACMTATKSAQLANGDSYLAYNFICVPNR